VNIHKLDKIFNPQRIALIGVTTNPNSVGGKVLSNLVGGGFRGVVYPVNPDNEAVLGIQCYHNVFDLPKTPDICVIYAPASEVPKLVRECGEADILGLIIMSAGFRETGSKGKELEIQIMEEKKKYDGMRIIGPNCLGIIAPGKNLNISFASNMPKKGNVAFVSQSGALCTSVLDWAIEEKIGFSYFVSIGNTLDVGYGEIIDYFGEDENTKSILLYIESINQARKFMTAARAFARTKPIVAYKAGRYPESAKVAASHTGAMASEDDVYDAAFQRIGLARVFDIGEIFDCAELIGKYKIPKGPHLGIVSNAGGPAVMATDMLIALNGALAKLSEKSIVNLNENLPPMWSHGNPVDVLGDARSKRIAKAVNIVLEDKNVDAVLVIITPQAMTNPTSIAKAISKLAADSSKPILAAWLGGQKMQEGIRILNDCGVATYMTPEQAVRSFMTLVAYSRNLKSLYETPRDIPVQFSINRTKLRSQFNSTIPAKGNVLSEDISKKLLQAYGISVTTPYPASTAEEAVKISNKIGYPVVLKILSPDITHKTDVGGVSINLENELMVRNAFSQILSNVRKKQPDIKTEGVLVQNMITEKDSLELILGIKKDSTFGTTIMIGSGGITAELIGDRALGFPPLNERLALRMIESLKICPLLNGYRGKPPINIDKLIETLIRLSYFAADYPEIVELDINPLLVSQNKVIALDARIVIDRNLIEKPIEQYAHLVLKPYPEEYVRSIEMRNGTKLTLRPIKPEDEPMWFNLLENCSSESIYARFRYFFKWHTHEVASRFCFIDYDREIAIVAESNEESERILLGVGRLIADPDHETVEYAVLVRDEWQNKGLGSILTDYCLEISKKWNLKRVVAQTTSDNFRMISVFKKRGFKITSDTSSSIVEVEKNLS